MKMKVTVRSGRFDSAGVHNDRQFDVAASKHIDPTKSGENRYWNYLEDHERTFKEIEQDFYKNTFAEHLEEKKQMYLRTRHPERAKTPEQYWSAKCSRPEDVILQIGDTYNHVSGEELWECAKDYRERFTAIWGDHCKILDMALHMDEATPHVHIRRVWITHDAEGNAYVNQKKSLNDLEITNPKRDGNDTRYSNAKMSFTESDRKLFHMVCKDHNLDIDETPEISRPHLSVNEYKVKELQNTKRAVLDAMKQMEMLMKNSESFAVLHANELTNIDKERNWHNRYKLTTILFKEMLQEEELKIRQINGTNKEIKRLKDEKALFTKYVKIKNLKSDFKKFLEQEREIRVR